MKKILRQFSHSLLLMKKNKLRTLLTSLGIIIASSIFVIGFIVCDSYFEAKKSYYKDFDQSSILIQDFRYNSNDLYERYKGSANVSLFKEAIIKSGDVINHNNEINYSIIGVDENYLNFPHLSIEKSDSLVNNKLIAGREINYSDIIAQRRVLNISKAYCDLLFGENEGLGKWIKIDEFKWQIVGILSDSNDIERSVSRINNNTKSISVRMYIPISSFNNVSNFLANDNQFFIIKFNEVNVNNEIKALKDVFPISSIFGHDERMNVVNKDAEMYKGLLTIAFIVITIFSSIIIMITMLFNVKERVFEIGIKRALGATADQIRADFIFEAYIYGLIGTFFGFVLGFISSLIIQLCISSITGGFVFSISAMTFFIPFVVSISFVILSGLIPAHIAAKTNIVKCLKVD